MALNPWQILRQIAFLAAAATWPVAPSDKILTGGCQISEDLEGNFLGSVGMDGVQHGFALPATNADQNEPPVAALPFARVHFVDAKPDPDAQGRYEEARFRVWVTCGKGGIAGDPLNTQGAQVHGTDSLVGSAYGPHGQGGSVGRGLEEVVQALILAGFTSGQVNAGSLDDTTFGIQAYVEDVPLLVPVDGVNVVSRPFDVVVTNAGTRPSYAPVRLLSKAGSGAGTIVLAWVAATTRFDTIPGAVPIVRYASGSTPPATPTSGTGAVGVTATGVTFSPGAGTWSVSVFVPYDSSMPGPPAAANNYSTPVSLTVTV